jgi:hypothetical protein
MDCPPSFIIVNNIRLLAVAPGVPKDATESNILPGVVVVVFIPPVKDTVTG